MRFMIRKNIFTHAAAFLRGQSTAQIAEKRSLIVSDKTPRRAIGAHCALAFLRDANFARRQAEDHKGGLALYSQTSLKVFHLTPALCLRGRPNSQTNKKKKIHMRWIAANASCLSGESARFLLLHQNETAHRFVAVFSTISLGARATSGQTRS